MFKLFLLGALPDYGGELLPALIYNVYNRHLEAASRDRVDDIVRTAKWSGPARMDPNVRRLIERSKRSREDMREDEKPTEPFEPRILIRHAYIELGRWASALLPADSHRFGTMESLAKLLSSATLRAGDGQRYLALAQTHQVDLRPLLSRGKIGTETYCPWKPPTGDEVLQLAPLADENADRLLVLTAPGRLVVLEPEVKENEQVLIIAKLELGTQHRASAMAIVPRRDGTFTVAIASHHDRRSELTLVDVHSNRLTRNDPLPLDLPRAEILDLSTDGKGGHWLMAGAKHGTRVLLRRLGDADAPCRMRILQSGTLALRFSAAEDPGYAVYGGLSGLLWCVDLEAEGSACDLAWTYQLQGAIRSIERLHIYGEAHFLVGTESGELCLLRARDGRRIWKGRVQAPVRHVVATEQPEPLVLVVMPRGLVASFTLITETDRVEAWDAFEGYLQTLQRLGVAHDDEAWNDPDGGGVKAFYELKRLNHSMIEVVASHQNRETRARLVRHLVQQPAAVEDEFPYIAGKLSFRDLTLLLSYLPDEFTAWDQTIRNELWRRDMSGERGDGSTGAAMAAMVTFIQRLGRQKPPILELIDSQPPEGYFHFPWARISFNRVLVQALDTECGDTRSMGPVIGILDHLLGLSPLLFTNAYCVFQYDSDEEKDCKALVAVLTGSRIAGSSFNKGLKRLAERLEAIAPPSNWLGVLHALAAIHDCALRCPDRQWAQWRRSILAALRRLAEIVFARGDWEPAVKPVVEGLAGFLHAGRFPVMRKRWRTGSDGSKAPGSTSRLNASRTPPRSLPRIRGASTLGICCTIRAGSYRRSSDGNASMCSGGFARAWNCCPRCARNARGGSSCDCR